MTTKTPLQKILQGILHTENESRKKHEKTGSTNHRRRQEKESKSNIDSSAHSQLLSNKNN
jgi:hypothetical protein